MATTTLRDFLVNLGFKLDENGLKKFTNSIDSATSKVMRFAVSVTAIAGTAALAIDKFTAHMEALYFSAQRVGSSTSALSAFAKTARNFGASVAEAQGSVEGLAAALRQSPGNAALLQGLLGRVGGHISADNVENMRQLAKVFQQMPMYQAELYSSRLGISENTMLAMRNGKFDQEFERQKKLNAGMDAGVDSAHKLQVSWQDLGTEVEVLGNKMLEAMGPDLLRMLERLEHYLETHDFNKTFKDWGDTINNYVVPPLEFLWNLFTKLDDATNGWTGKVLALTIALRALAGINIATGGLKLLAKAMGVATSELGVAAAAGVGAGWGFDKLFPNNWLANFGRFFADRATSRNPADYISELTGQHGISGTAARGIVANLMQESGLVSTAEGDNKQAYGLAQWHSPYWAQFQKMFGHDIHSSSVGEQMRFLMETVSSNPQLMSALKGARTASDAAVAFSNYYERPAGGAAEAAARGRIAARLEQNVVIHIDGAQSPQATGDAVVKSLTSLQRTAANPVQ